MSFDWDDFSETCRRIARTRNESRKTHGNQPTLLFDLLESAKYFGR